MLHRLFQMQVLLYVIIGSGVAGLAVMQVMAWMTRKKVSNPKTYASMTQHMRRTGYLAGAIILIVLVFTLVSAFLGKATRTELLQYAAYGAGACLLLAAFYRYLSFGTLAQVIGDYMLEIVGHKNKDKAVDKALAPVTRKEKQVDKVMKGIQETAAAGDNRFSHLMTPEEEAVMRDVIREFMA